MALELAQRHDPVHRGPQPLGHRQRLRAPHHRRQQHRRRLEQLGQRLRALLAHQCAMSGPVRVGQRNARASFSRASPQ
ncbi:MAG: hypothetical protein ACRDJC_26825, partial [Thermomicrobiales bacterium]